MFKRLRQTGVIMTKTTMLVIVLGIAVGFALLVVRTPKVEGRLTTPNISIQELHARGHLEALPIQEFEDMSFVFTAPQSESK